MTRTIAYEIPEALPGQNTLLRMHWAKRKRLRERVAWLTRAALLESGYRIGEPLVTRCRITVTRRSRRKLDADGAHSCCKHILDVLQPLSKTHPNGLGIIANDDSACVESLVVKQEAGQAAMRVEIEVLA